MSEYLGGGGGGSLRVPRQRNASTRGARDSSYFSTPTIIEDGNPQHQYQAQSQGQPYGYQNSLRRPSSRTSLNDQFAATRSVYEFGFDDAASSVFDRATSYSRAGAERAADMMSIADGAEYEQEEGEEGGVDDDEDDSENNDPYEALILPRDPDLSPDDIRRAYHRLFLLFYPGSYPQDLRSTAHGQFSLVQAAFEKLIDPERRQRHHLAQLQLNDCLSSHRIGIRDFGYGSMVGGTSHLGIRFDVRESSKRRQAKSRAALDYALGHSATAGLPALRRVLSRAARGVQPGIEVLLPSLTVSGAAYGVVDHVSSVPVTVLSDAYQPLLPATIPRRRLLQLVESKLSPVVAARLHTGFVPSHCLPRSLRTGSLVGHTWLRTDVELESTVLPDRSVGARISHQVVLPALQIQRRTADEDEDIDEYDEPLPTTLDIGVSHSVDAGLLHSVLPRLSLGARHTLPGGVVFFRADSGDGLPAGDRVCRFLTGFAEMGGGMRFAEFPLRTPPSLEMGFQTQPCPPLPATPSRGHWTAAVTTSADGVRAGGYVRYSTELALMRGQAAAPNRRRRRRRRLLLEAEICSDAFQGRHVALRSLLPAGDTSKLGLELGITTHSIHLSVHWSRLGQRLTLPLLISTHELQLGGSLAMWAAAAAPFLALAAFHLLPNLMPRGRNSNKKGGRRRGITSSRDHDRRRADLLTSLLAHPVTARQRHITSSSSSSGVLNIISAKYGVFEDSTGGGGEGWGGEEVADVTIALAALVSDDGRSLAIPAGVRKARIPGFWDPDPDAEKVLHVRYAWQGKEAVIEVKGERELILPPPQP